MRICVVLLAAVLLGHAAAHPAYFVDTYANGCIDHPTRRFSGHAGPTPDPGTTFVVTNAQGNRASQLCPGATYTLTVNYPEPRQALITSNAGTFANSDPSCPGRFYVDESTETITAPWSIPCNFTGGVQIKSTAAPGSRGGFKFVAQRVDVLPADSTACATLSSICRGGAAAAGTLQPLSATGDAAMPAAVTGAAAGSSGRGGRDVVWPGLGGMDRALMQMLHNILMMAAFALLLPMGMLLARHKWMFGRNPLTGKVHASWYYTHILVQLLGVLAAAGGVAVIILTYGWKRVASQSLYEPHKWIGLAVMGMSLLQVLLAPCRPSLTSSARPCWNAFHWNWGRLIMISGIANTIIGAVLLHNMKGDSYLFWLLPTCACFGLVALVGVLLEAFKLQYERTHRYNPRDHSMHSVLDMHVSIKDDRQRLVAANNSHSDVEGVPGGFRDQYPAPHGATANGTHGRRH